LYANFNALKIVEKVEQNKGYSKNTGEGRLSDIAIGNLSLLQKSLQNIILMESHVFCCILC